MRRGTGCPGLESQATTNDPVPWMRLVAGLAGFGWGWACVLLACREHQVEPYFVLAAPPPLWGAIGLPAWKLLLAAGVTGVWITACLGHARRQDHICPPATRWLLLAYVIPLLDAFRLVSFDLPCSWLEPLGFALISGLAMAVLAADAADRGDIRPAVGLAAVGLLTVAAGAWWYWQGCQAYGGYLLGYHDFGHFARRVVNTWEGRGFLLETPGLPAFWDHFNPGLALLAPLWGLWPDARLFILLQAVCLAAPAPLVWGIARAWGARPLAAAAWAVAYLAFPSVGQLNLNYTYGWHPVSVALPLVFLAVWLMMPRRSSLGLRPDPVGGDWQPTADALVGTESQPTRTRSAWRMLAAGLALVLACSFEETILVAMACLAASLALQAWWVGRRTAAGADAGAPEFLLARQLPAWGWLILWAVLTASFVVVFKLAAFAHFQTARFANLGDSALEIAAAPLLRPAEFWGQVLRPASGYFLLGLTVPLGVRAVLRGWWFLLAVALPVGVLLAWQRAAATSLAFQYVTMLIPVLVLAAIAGSTRHAGPRRATGDNPAARPAGAELPPALAALVSGLTASVFFGAVPWSSPTLSVVVALTYQTKDVQAPANPRAAGTAGHALLEDIVAQVRQRDAAVLASGRIAAHLLGVRRLESVEMAVTRWDALSAEAGAGRSAVELFDWIVLDTCEQFQQSEEKVQAVAAAAQRAGYQAVRSAEGIVVLKKPDN